MEAMSACRPHKIPASVLVVIHTPAPEPQVLLLRRTGGTGDPTPGAAQEFWQSVTGSKDYVDEPWDVVAVREVAEETGIDALAPGCVLRDWGLENVDPIYPQWLHRYAPGVCLNTERLFSLQVPSYVRPTLSPREHTAFAWHSWREAAARCYAPSNAEAILLLPSFLKSA